MPTDKMPTNANIDALYDRTVVDQSGNKIGEIGQVYLDDASGQPAWVTVKTGLFGRNETFVPFKGLETSSDQVRTPYTKDKVKDAPSVDPDGHLSEDETDELYRYYSDAFASDTKTTDKNVERGVAGGVAGQQAADSKKVTDTKSQTTVGQKLPVAEDGSVVRHEERLNVGKERVETGRVRIRKHVVHDTETVEVPVEREEVSVERTPISAEDAKNYNGTISGDTEEASVTLHEEQVNVNKETVPVEKINLKKDTVRDTETHTEELRKEQIDTDGVDGLKK